MRDKFLESYEKYADPIFRFIYFRVYDREISKELTQEAFMKTWEYAAKGNQIENFRAFLYQVARNLVNSFHRDKKEQSLDQLIEEGFQPGVDEKAQNDIKIEVKKIIRTMNRLPIKYRDILKMRYLEDLRPKEIAEIMGKTENAISVSLNRGLAKLKQLLQ